MAQTTVEIKNLTGSHVSISDLVEGLIPAGQTKLVSQTNEYDDIISSVHLYNLVFSDSVSIVWNGVELTKSQALVTLDPKGVIVVESTNSATQSLTGSPTVLSGMSLVLGVGEWEVDCSGLIQTNSTIVRIALYEDGSEIDGANGHTTREIGDVLLGIVSSGSFNTSAKIVVASGTVTVTCQGEETTGVSGSFEKGRIRAIKIK